MNLDPIIDRLAALPNAFRKVAGTADLEAARQTPPKQLPTAFVTHNSERTSKNNLALPALSQRNEVTFSVIYCVQNLRDARGHEAFDLVQPLRDTVIASLLLFVPASGYEPIEKSNARLLAFQDQVLWFQDDFMTAHYYRKVP